MDAEEDAILPAYTKRYPEDAQAIYRSHQELRRQLFRLGVEVELHEVRAETLEQLVQSLRSHSAHEDRGMYPWARAQLPPRTKLELFTRIRHSIQLLALDTKHPAKRGAAAAPAATINE